MSRFIGIEAGGTKFVCAIGDASGLLINRECFPTETPDITLNHVIDYIHRNLDETIIAIGIACFGPIELNPLAKNYGYITNSPKPYWQDIDIVGRIKSACDLPIGFDTDVNAAARGEYRFGSLDNIHSFIYMTVGTGIGCGCIINGEVLYGMSHPEMGHMLIPHDEKHDNFSGACPFHQNCLEGLASGTAINKRWSVHSALDLSVEHEAWDLEANYLALACVNITLMLSPQKIMLGGGVMKQRVLFAKIRDQLKQLLNGYVTYLLEDYIVPPTLGENAGIMGAIALAEQCAIQVQEEKLAAHGKVYQFPYKLIPKPIV